MRFISVVLIALSVGSAAQAVPPEARVYRLDLVFDQCFESCDVDGPVRLGPTYSGHFAIAEEVFAVDGYTDAKFRAFSLQLGETTWNSLVPGPDTDGVEQSFNPLTGNSTFGQTTFLVQNGELAGLCCGIRGPADFPWAQLFSWVRGADLPPNTVYASGFQTRDPILTWAGIRFNVVGTFSVHRMTVAGLLEHLRSESTGVGAGKSLADKLLLALTYYAVADVPSACATLQSYLEALTAQKKKLTALKAEALSGEAAVVMNAIACDFGVTEEVQ